MTKEEINTAIAEACGWQDIKRCTRRLKPDAQGVALMGIDPDGDHTGGATEYASVPSYTTDLNAIHEAVVAFKQTVNDPDRRWSNALMLVIQDHECCGAVEARYRTANATALQRAEAFLRALNKWKE